MRVLFAHDHPFISIDGNVYSETQFPSSVWQRYLKHFSSITVFSRKKQLISNDIKNNLQLSSMPNVAFEFGPNLSSPLAQLRLRHAARLQLRHILLNMDAVIARLPSELGLVAIYEAQRSGLPWAIELAGCPWDGLWNYGKWQGKFYAPVMAARTRSVVSRAKFVLYVTNKFLQNRYPNRHGNTISCSNVDIPSPLQSVLNKRLENISTRKQKVVLGLIGTLRTRYKGIQTVFQALAIARTSLPGVEFRILGDGDVVAWHNEAIRYGIQDIVFFDGVLPSGPPVLEWLDNIDVYLQPSLKEGLPRALIEAMSRGCPAIASKCAGIPELLDEKNLIRPGDAMQLAQLLEVGCLNTVWQQHEAIRNWQVACDYSRDKLMVRRNAFWGEFAEYVANVKSNRVTL